MRIILKPKQAYFFILLSVVFWCFLILLAPILAHFKHTLSSGFIYLFFSNICHQIPERSIVLFNNQMAVCARCSGVYFGFLIGLLSYPFLSKNTWHVQFKRRYFYLALVPITVDFSFQFLGICENTNVSRFVTGAILGGVTAFFVIPGFINLFLKKGEDYGEKTR